jgi:multiple sugar transport system permease protein
MRKRHRFFFGKYEGKREGAMRFYDMHSPGVRIGAVIVFVVCVLMALVAIFPIVWAFLAGFKEPAEFNTSTSLLPSSFDLSGYIKTWNQLDFLKHYRNSGIQILGGVVCAVLFNGLLAYGLAILRPKGHKIVFGLVLWCMLIPPTTGVVAQYVNINNLMNAVGKLLGTNLRGTVAGFVPLWLIMGANAFWVILFKNFFEGLPKEYLEAAQLDGCSRLQVFFRIMLPLSKPIIGVVVVFAIAAAWSDFLLPYLMLQGTEWSTVMVRLFEFDSAIRSTSTDILRGVVFALIPPVILFAVFQKQITQGIAAGGLKG